MKNTAIIGFLLIFVTFNAYAGNPTLEAANKNVKDVNWREESIIVGDFSCQT